MRLTKYGEMGYFLRRLENLERFPSGQRGQTVNLLLIASKVRILPSPSEPLRGRGFFYGVLLPTGRTFHLYGMQVLLCGGAGVCVSDR